jgi:hypothetical protein
MMTKGLACSCLAAIALVAAPAVAEQTASDIEISTEHGRLQDLIASLASEDYVLGEPGRDPRPYVDPTPLLHAFRHLATALAWGNIHDAALQAAKLDYQLIKFIDANTQARYYVLREDLTRVKATRGWGSYIINPDCQVQALVEVPHPLADAQTPEIGGAVFERAGCKGFLLAGAHRLKADVPDLVDSVFHQVHTAWVGPRAQVAAWQIHGFTSAKHSFPGDAHVIASTGDGVVLPAVAALDAKFESEGVSSYVFNMRPAESKLNRRLNGDVPGLAFSALAATTNEQGRLCRSLGGSFVHVELESQLRLDAQQRERAATVIAAAMRDAPELEPDEDEPAVQVVAFTPEERPASIVETKPRAGEVEATDPAIYQESDDVDLARAGSMRPPRSDGSRPRRNRKPTS